MINYSKQDFSKEVMKITGKQGSALQYLMGLKVKKHFKDPIACLKTRGMMVSFGNASGPLDPINVPKKKFNQKDYI